MKTRLIIGVIAVVILVVILGVYLFPSGEKCANAGESSSNPSLGPDENPRECCEGLVEISWDLRYEPGDEMADENGCVMTVGAGSICSDCGNGICEEWEDKCRCPRDCT